MLLRLLVTVRLDQPETRTDLSIGSGKIKGFDNCLGNGKFLVSGIFQIITVDLCALMGNLDLSKVRDMQNVSKTKYEI